MSRKKTANNHAGTAAPEADAPADAGYPVYETFHSWQGEGDFAGRSAFFIRLFGCPVRCDWCDSRGTWDPAFAPAEIPQIRATRLAEMARESRAEFVVITGGEPAVHDLGSLVGALGAIPAHIETSGVLPLRAGAHGTGAWVTVSPKRGKPVLRENLLRADEIKLVISSPADLPYWHGVLHNTARTAPLPRRPSVWLHPEWSHHADATLLTAITRWVRHCGAPYRAGWQIHKCYNADPPPPAPRKL